MSQQKLISNLELVSSYFRKANSNKYANYYSGLAAYFSSNQSKDTKEYSNELDMVISLASVVHGLGDMCPIENVDFNTWLQIVEEIRNAALALKKEIR